MSEFKPGDLVVYNKKGYIGEGVETYPYRKGVWRVESCYNRFGVRAIEILCRNGGQLQAKYFELYEEEN